MLAAVILTLGCVSPAEQQLVKGNSFRDLEQWDEAIAAYSKAIELDPNLAIAYAGRGFAYYSKDDYDNVIADYTKVIELDPTKSLSYGIRGFSNHELF